MVILFYCWEFPPVGSGIGAYIQHMSRALMSAGHEVVVVSSRSPHHHEKESLGNNGTIYRIYDYSQVGGKVVAAQVLKIAKRHQADWIEVADHLGEGAALLLMRDRPPVVVKSHYNDVIPRVRYGQARWWWQRILIDLACLRDRQRICRERDSMALANGLLFITRRMLREAQAANLRLPEKIAVIPNPIEALPAWINNEAQNPTMLFVGRIDFGKGVDFLPAILRSVVQRFPSARLEIAGGDGFARGVGSIRRWVKKRFRDLAEHVMFLGHVTPQEINEAYRRAWLVLVPSRWDTFPMAVLEAMARGKAIVASPHGGMPEMLEGTKNIVVHPSENAFAEAVIELLDNNDSRYEAGRSGRDKALQSYDPARIADEYVNTVRQWL